MKLDGPHALRVMSITLPLSAMNRSLFLRSPRGVSTDVSGSSAPTARFAITGGLGDPVSWATRYVFKPVASLRAGWRGIAG